MILLTGGSGVLGQEIQKHIDCWSPPREYFDIRYHGFKLPRTDERPGWTVFYPNSGGYKTFEPPTISLIVHCAAYTDLVSAENNKQECYNVNVIGTRNLTSLGIPMVYISTEYVFDGEKGNYEESDYPNPQNWYAVTKLLGEYEARRTRSVVIRCLFKPRPFEHANACDDMWTTGDSVNVIAEEIAQAIKIFDKLPETIHIGTGRKSVYELACKTRPDVGRISREEIRGLRLPRDTSLNTSLWEKIKNEKS